MLQTIEMILDDFALLDDWEDRYRYLIELGRGLPPLSEDERSEKNRVSGCASQVWLVVSTKEYEGERKLNFQADSDAHIVRGLLAILLTLYNNKTAQEILAVNAENIFHQLDFSAHLSQQRSNGLKSILSRIRAKAEYLLTNT